MSFTVKRVVEDRKSGGDYRYMVMKDEKDFAIFSHDFRGEVASIKVLKSGFKDIPPFGMCTEFLTGGGPEPLGLSSMAMKYLEKLLKEKET